MKAWPLVLLALLAGAHAPASSRRPASSRPARLVPLACAGASCASLAVDAFAALIGPRSRP